jgi:hypothetical protein
MTSTTVASGSNWSSNTLYDGWGAETPDELAAELGNLVVARFEELVTAHGGNAAWFPKTSEVIAAVYGQNTDEHGMWDEINPLPDGITYDDLREQATSEVWDAFCGERNVMTQRVNALVAEHQPQE